MTMNILLFTQQLAAYRSGVGTYAMNLVQGLAARGHRLTVVLPDRQVQPIPGVDFVTVSPSRVDPTPGGWFSLGASFARVLRDIQGRFDVAHFTDAREAWCRGKRATPVTGMVNDAYALDWVRPGYPRRFYSDRFLRGAYYAFLRRLEKSTYPHFDALMANSAYVKREITVGYGMPADEVSIVHYGLTHPPAPESIDLAGKPAVLFIGGNFHRKGLAVLIEATALLAPRLPGIHLHVVGEDRNRPAFVELAARRRVTGRVTFHGWMPNEAARGMIAGADIFVLPSMTEGFGLVLLEAMQLDTPCVATREGGAREVFQPGLEALFVDPMSAHETAHAIERIATNEAVAAALRENGRLAAARFTPSAMAERTEAVWDSLASR